MGRGVLVDLELMRNQEWIRDKELVIWGSGDKGGYGIRMLRKAGISVSMVCDSNAELWGTEREGHTVVSPDALCHADARRLCVFLCVAPGNYRAVRKALDQILDGGYQYATYFGIVNLFRFHYETLFSEEYDKWLFRLEEDMGLSTLRQSQLCKLHDIYGVEDGDIMVLQPGKVGSCSVVKSICGKERRLMHVHHLGFPSDVLQESYKGVWEMALKNMTGKRLKVIAGVREPIGRDISAFFQMFSEGNEIFRRGDWILGTGDLYQGFGQYEDMIVRHNYEPWRNGILGVWGDEFLWFDEEIKKLWGIDIYEYPFDREKGYSVIRCGGIELFLYKSEKLNEVTEELHRFVSGSPAPHFASVNLAETSWRNEAYQEFQKNVLLDPAYVNHYYQNNPRMDHFYTEEEKKNFLKNWEGRIGRKV